jgi:hypothetical protein
MRCSIRWLSNLTSQQCDLQPVHVLCRLLSSPSPSPAPVRRHTARNRPDPSHQARTACPSASRLPPRAPAATWHTSCTGHAGAAVTSTVRRSATAAGTRSPQPPLYEHQRKAHDLQLPCLTSNAIAMLRLSCSSASPSALLQPAWALYKYMRGQSGRHAIYPDSCRNQLLRAEQHLSPRNKGPDGLPIVIISQD